MNILITVLLVIAGIIALLLIIGLFSRKDYAISREVLINKPVSVVFDYVKYLRNQEHYFKYVMMDPAMKKEFVGTDATPGFIYHWDSQHKSVGKGSQEIKRIVDNEKIDYEVVFIKPFEGVLQSSLYTAPVGESGTKVTWTSASRMKYPMNLMLLFMNMENMIGKDFDESLQNLKKVLEK
ncbi:SRPBCC family protein [Chitinophaga sp. GCM10012297]|uniref:SRPBCC family protein n=1 Tax=Chitinophaga chungangae TaxID=2821488 RepID=A0ABS3YGI5_9BACT|nr:SRPBCC family protein [Chitinophaga chungangae]MBO9153791.1 SRPBCC family protein [Chitinophaga chungangae]